MKNINIILDNIKQNLSNMNKVNVSYVPGDVLNNKLDVIIVDVDFDSNNTCLVKIDRIIRKTIGKQYIQFNGFNNGAKSKYPIVGSFGHFWYCLKNKKEDKVYEY